MAKVTWDVTNVDDLPDQVPPPVGIYRAEIVHAEAKDSSNGNPMISTRWKVTHDASGAKIKEAYGLVFDNVLLEHDHPFVQGRLKEFISALGLKKKGGIDTDKLVGMKAQLKLKSDTDQDGDYRPRIGKIMALSVDDDPEPEDDEEPEEEDDDEEAIDLSSLSRSELKKLIKEEELEIKVTTKMSDDDIREAIEEAMSEEEEEEEPEEDEPEEDEPEDDGYDDMSPADLKAELKERELPTSGAKKILIARLRKDDADEPF